MESLDFFRNLFEYDYWGNREALESVQALAGLGAAGAGSVAERPLKLLGHIIGTERIWLARFETPEPKGADTWPAVPLADCAAAFEELHLRWRGLLANFAAEELSHDMAYRNTKGAEFKTPVGDVLTHLVMHSAYHRGQVAAAVREAGGKPAATDYIVWVRQVKAANAAALT